jgi:hypothetical protein
VSNSTSSFSPNPMAFLAFKSLETLNDFIIDSNEIKVITKFQHISNAMYGIAVETRNQGKKIVYFESQIEMENRFEEIKNELNVLNINFQGLK